jgi:hypothetical protein
MADQPSPERPFQFRLRTLIIAVTLLAVACACVHFTSQAAQQRAAQQAAALERVKELGGKPIWFKELGERPSEDGGGRKLYCIAMPISTKFEELHAIQVAFPDVPIFPLRADGSIRFEDDSWSKYTSQPK